MKKILLFVAGCLLLSACASMQTANIDWIPIGPEFPPTKAKSIEVISDRSEVKRPYGILGLCRLMNLSPDRETLRMGVERGRKFIATKGADGMIIIPYNSAEDGDPNPRVTLSIYAIKYVDQLTEEDKKAMEDFEVLGILNEYTAS